MEGTIDSSGVRIYYRRLGKRGVVPPLVCLHGGPGGSHDILIPGTSSLAEERDVILYDQRGCGRSGRLTPETPCTVADNVLDLDVLRKQLVLGPIDLMGHSWGGLLALMYALDRPDHVRRLVLVTPALVYYPNSGWTEFLDTLSPEKLAEIDAVRRSDRSPVARQAAVWRLTIREFFHREEALKQIDLQTMPFSPQVGERIARDLEGLDLRPRLQELHTPTLVVAGRHDPRLQVHHHENLTRLFPHARLHVMEESGHFPFLEEPEHFACVVDEFLR